MSEQPTATARQPAGAGKKYAGLSRNQWILVGGVFAVAVGWILWKRHEASKAAASTATASSTSSATSQELAALQAEIDQLLSEQQGAGAGGSNWYASGGGGSAGTATGTSGAGPSTKTGTSTLTGTPTAPVTSTAGAISNLVVTATGKTTARATWNAASGATGGYAYQVKQMNGKLVKSGNTHATSVTITGLHAGWTYNFGIQALPGGPGNNEHFTTKS